MVMKFTHARVKKKMVLGGVGHLTARWIVDLTSSRL